jgi:hypothetical protein
MSSVQQRLIKPWRGGGHPADGLGDGGPATAARLNSPNSVCVDRAGNLFFTESKQWQPAGNQPEDNGNDLVREVIGVTVPQ